MLLRHFPRLITAALTLPCILQTPSLARALSSNTMTSFHQFKANDVHGNEVDFSSLSGRIVLITNVASK